MRCEHGQQFIEFALSVCIDCVQWLNLSLDENGKNLVLIKATTEKCLAYLKNKNSIYQSSLSKKKEGTRIKDFIVSLFKYTFNYKHTYNINFNIFSLFSLSLSPISLSLSFSIMTREMELVWSNTISKCLEWHNITLRFVSIGALNAFLLCGFCNFVQNIP